MERTLTFLNKCRVEESSLLIAVTNSTKEIYWYHYSSQYIGVERIITRADRLSNEKVFEEIGVDVVRSARGAAIRKVVHQLIEDKPVRTELEHGDFQLIEMTLPGRFLNKRFLIFHKTCFCHWYRHSKQTCFCSIWNNGVAPQRQLLVIVDENDAEEVRYILTGSRTEG